MQTARHPSDACARNRYLAASSASAYSMVSMVSNFGPLMPPGSSCISLTYLASERVVPGYGGGAHERERERKRERETTRGRERDDERERGDWREIPAVRCGRPSALLLH